MFPVTASPGRRRGERECYRIHRLPRRFTASGATPGAPTRPFPPHPAHIQGEDARPDGVIATRCKSAGFQACLRTQPRDQAKIGLREDVCQLTGGYAVDFSTNLRDQTVLDVPVLG
jgi:hypothetical protein